MYESVFDTLKCEIATAFLTESIAMTITSIGRAGSHCHCEPSAKQKAWQSPSYCDDLTFLSLRA